MARRERAEFRGGPVGATMVDFARTIDAFDTVRYAAELGYEVTMVKDATASYFDEHMRAALEINIPNYASSMVTTEGIVATISALHEARISAGR
jgi:hypothetical protein